MIKSTRTDVVTTYKSIRNLSACVEKSGELGWVVVCSLGGRGGMGKKKGKKKEKQRKRVSTEWLYNGFYWWNHLRTGSVGDSASESATSLYDYLDLNPSVIPSVKSSEKIHIITPLQLSKKTVLAVGDTVDIYRRTYSVGKYRPYHQRTLSVCIYRQIWRRNYFRREKLPMKKYHRQFHWFSLIFW